MTKAKSLGSANGVKGCLLRPMGDGPAIFRVYDAEHEFRDYEILHHDLDITINDDSGEFFEFDGNYFLDYSDESMEPAEDVLDAYNEERLVSKYDKGADT